MKYTNSFRLLFFLVVATTRCWAQQPDGKFEEWGKVTLDDFKVTECSFEKDADVVMLLDLGQVYFEEGENFYNEGKYRITSAYYQRYKVLADKGTSKANFKFKYNVTSKESITDIEAVCYNLDDKGQIIKTELLPKDIQYNKLNEYQSEVVFSVPGVKKGSVFEVKHKRSQPFNYTLPDWYFSTVEPSLKSVISIGFLDPIVYYTEEDLHDNKFTKATKHYISNVRPPNGYGSKLPGTTVTYSAENLHSVPDEPFMNSRKNYMDHLEFQLRELKAPWQTNNIVSTFMEFNRSLMNKPAFGDNITGEGIPKKFWKDLIKDTMTPEEKAETIFEFVRQNLQWDGNISCIPKNDNSKTWKNKTGSSAEINMLLYVALKQAGLNVRPALASTRVLGYPDEEYPMMSQFKSLMVFLDMGSDKKMLLDASNKYLPFGLTKYDALDNFVYILNGTDDYLWVNTFNLGSNSENTSIVATMDKDGLIKGSVHIIFDNYLAADLRIARGANNDAFITEQIKKRVPTANIEKTSDSSNTQKGKFYEDIQFSKQSLSDNDGNIYISLPDIYGQTNNPFTSSTRISDVDFGYKQKTTATLALQLPDNYVVDSLIPAVQYIMADSSISFTIQTELTDGTLYIRQTLEYKKSFYPVAQYPDFYDFHQKYYKLIQQAVMLKKKS